MNVAVRLQSLKSANADLAHTGRESKMQAKTMRDLGALARSSRRAQGLTQAELAVRLGVGREWVVRLERGHPRLEAQKVLDALIVLGLTLDVSHPQGTRNVAQGATKTSHRHVHQTKGAVKKPVAERPSTRAAAAAAEDPFDALFAKRNR
ncbi:MAG: helix-turn-helix domain-containing protein [Nocardioides sp.]|uniref:helix-turn-helix domain-containing protein n=1 Tax=Nocardioides sp. TaxID=35761 RepID=UPI003266080B